MELAHAVGRARQAQGHHRHVEGRRGHRRVGLPQRHHLVERDAALVGKGREVLLHQLAREQVDPRRHRRVRREHHAGPGRLDRPVELHVFGGDEAPDALQGEEPGVALVEVVDGRADVEQLEGSAPADAEDDLLAQAVLDLAAVEAVGHTLLVGGVALDVGVEQVEGHAPDLGPPHLKGRHAAGQVDVGQQRVAVIVAYEGDGEGVGVELRVVLLLPAVEVEVLAEVALRVEEADGNEGDALVGGRLQVVAGEHAEAARVDREGLGDAELGREVGDGRGGAHPVLVPAGVREVAAQFVEHDVEV